MLGVFKQISGHFYLGSKTDADLWLLNSCTVKNPAEDHFRNEIKLAQTLDKKVVVAGCVPQGERKSGYLQVGVARACWSRSYI